MYNVNRHVELLRNEAVSRRNGGFLAIGLDRSVCFYY